MGKEHLTENRGTLEDQISRLRRAIAEAIAAGDQPRADRLQNELNEAQIKHIQHRAGTLNTQT